MKSFLFLLISWHFSSKQKKEKNNERVLLIAHRGLTSRHLENSLPAITAAFKAGLDGVEFDVQLTKDLVPMVTHDRSFLRLAGVDKNIDNMIFDEVKKIEQKAIYYEDNYSTASLEEVLKHIPVGKLVNIELKETVEDENNLGIKIILDIINSYKLKLNIVISSFSPRILTKVLEYDLGFSMGLLIDEKYYLQNYFQARKIVNRLDFLNPHISLVNKTTSPFIKKMGVRLIFWGHKKMGKEGYIFKDNHFAIISDVADYLLRV